MRVRLIRHAQSETNAGLPTTAPGAAALTPLGVSQAHALTAVFARPPQLIVISEFLRTSQTAAGLIARFPDVPVLTLAIQEFTYLAPAKYVNTTLKDRAPQVAAYWQAAEPFTRDGEGAESFADFVARVEALRVWLEDQQRAGREELAIFSHGQFLKCFVLRLLSPHLFGQQGDMRLAMLRFRAFREGFVIPNAAYLELRLDDGAEPRLSGVATDHLNPGPLTY